MEERSWEFDRQDECNYSEVKNRCLLIVGDKLQTSVLFLLLQSSSGSTVSRHYSGRLPYEGMDQSGTLLLGHHTLTFFGYHATQNPNQFTDRVCRVPGAHLGLILCLGEYIHLPSLRLFFFQNFY